MTLPRPKFKIGQNVIVANLNNSVCRVTFVREVSFGKFMYHVRIGERGLGSQEYEHNLKPA